MIRYGIRTSAGAERSLSAGPSSSQSQQPLIELLEHNVRPGHFNEYLKLTNDNAQLQRSLYPLRFFSFPDTGGQLLTATHAYCYEGGHTERDQLRNENRKNAAWAKYEDQALPLIDSCQSNIFVEASLVSEIPEVSGLSKEGPGELESASSFSGDQQDPGNCILELRRYHLKLGYDTVPKFLEFYEAGLPSKLRAPGNCPTTSLVTLLYSDVGRLNEVIEIWRHGNGTTAMEQSRAAARSAKEWRTAIANIAGLAIQFTTSIHRPTWFSPIK